VRDVGPPAASRLTVGHLAVGVAAANVAGTQAVAVRVLRRAGPRALMASPRSVDSAVLHVSRLLADALARLRQGLTAN
jgi:hypothetical protein